MSADVIRKHANVFSKKVCKRLFDGAQIVVLGNLNKPTDVVVDSVTEPGVPDESGEEEASLIEESMTVNIILITTVLSIGLLLVNLCLFFCRF